MNNTQTISATQRIEFFYRKCPNTNTTKLDLIDEDLCLITTLEPKDFVQMNAENFDIREKEHIIAYCNKHKGTEIKKFIPTIF